MKQIKEHPRRSAISQGRIHFGVGIYVGFVALIVALSAFLVAFNLCTPAPPVSAQTPPSDTRTKISPTAWRLPADLVEDMDRRTRNSMQFVRPDGKRVSVLSKNLFYEPPDQPGKWDSVNLNFALDGTDDLASRNWFHTRLNSTGLTISDPKTGTGVRWLLPGRPTVRDRFASLTSRGVVWTWSVEPSRVKLNGIVTSTLGPRTYTFQYQLLGGVPDFQIVNGHAITTGVKVHAPTVIGANKVQYPVVGWVTAPGPKLAFIFDDTLLPAAAYPYVIDPTTTLQPDATGFDTHLDSVDTTTNYGTNINVANGDDDATNSVAVRGLIKFDVSSIPSGDTVTAVTFSLFEEAAGVNGGTVSGAYELQVLLRDWVEGQATWNIYSTGNSWTTAGAASAGNDLRSAISATLTLDATAAVAFVDWSGATLTQDVQDFVSGALANYGWRLAVLVKEFAGGAQYSYTVFKSSDQGVAAERPKLVVTHSAPVVTAAITGTIGDGATEQEVRDGAGTIIITLTGATWEAAGAAFDAQRSNIIQGLDAAQAETRGWNAQVRDQITVGSVVRTSNTVVTITITASEVAGYGISANEVITTTVPDSAHSGTGAITATPTSTITNSAGTAAVTGTATPSLTEQEGRTGGETIVITLTNEFWTPAANFNAQRQGIINNLDSAQAETRGWDLLVRGTIPVTDVVRTSNTVVTITLSAAPGYSVTNNETITVTVPAAATVSNVAITGSPTFQVLAGLEILTIAGSLGGSGGTAAEIRAGGETITYTVSGAATQTAGATFDAARQEVLTNIDSAQSDEQGWDAQRSNLPVTNVARTSGSVVTVTLSALTGYAVPATETLTATIPASGAYVFPGILTGSPTFNIVPSFVASGTRVSPAINLSSVTDVAYCGLAWAATTPTGTTVTVDTSINGGSSYTTGATNGACPTGLTVGASLATITDFRIRLNLATTDSTVTPLVNDLVFVVEDTSGESLRYQLNTLPGVTITDRSGSGNTGTMSYPVRSSTISSTTGDLTTTRTVASRTQALAPKSVASEVTGAAVSDNFFGNDPGNSSIPLFDIVSAISTAGDDLPIGFVWALLIGIGGVVLGIVIVELTGSLFAAAIGMGIMLAMGAVVGNGLIPGWTVFVFLPIAAAFILLRPKMQL